MINELGNDENIPWLMGGDFNEVIQESEKRGGGPCDFNNLCKFRECLDLNNLRDMPADGYPFTWRNNRAEGFIEEKLDRLLQTHPGLVLSL